MEIYKNNYAENEDYMLWELHEIRHRLHNARKGKFVEEINKQAFKKFTDWKEEIKEKKINGKSHFAYSKIPTH